MATDPLDALRLPIVAIEPRPEFAAGLLRRISERGWLAPTDTATVRYFVDDLDRAIDFYAGALDFEVELHPSPHFAMLYRGDLRLLLSDPAGGGHVLPDGTVAGPGGWNRISLRVTDIAESVAALRARGVRLRTDVTTGVGVRQVLLQDPAGNLVELFEPLSGYHERTKP
jgi:catechol 2,3-dioxygenase-like lactoylglutathione lyase family enzyme